MMASFAVMFSCAIPKEGKVNEFNERTIAEVSERVKLELFASCKSSKSWIAAVMFQLSAKYQ